MGKHGLTTQQWHVVTKLGQGKSRAEVAEMMGISVNTVKDHLQGALRNLRVDSFTQANNVLRREDREESLRRLVEELESVGPEDPRLQRHALVMYVHDQRVSDAVYPRNP